MEDLMDRMLLLAAWRKPAGPTPKRKMPNTYNTVTEAASEITRLREENKLLREALHNAFKAGYVQHREDEKNEGTPYPQWGVNDGFRRYVRSLATKRGE